MSTSIKIPRRNGQSSSTTSTGPSTPRTDLTASLSDSIQNTPASFPNDSPIPKTAEEKGKSKAVATRDISAGYSIAINLKGDDSSQSQEDFLLILPSLIPPRLGRGFFHANQQRRNLALLSSRGWQWRRTETRRSMLIRQCPEKVCLSKMRRRDP